MENMFTHAADAVADVTDMKADVTREVAMMENAAVKVAAAVINR